MPEDTYVELPNGQGYVQVPADATPDQLSALRTRLATLSSSSSSQVSRRPGGAAPAPEAAGGSRRPRRPSPPSQQVAPGTAAITGTYSGTPDTAARVARYHKDWLAGDRPYSAPAKRLTEMAYAEEKDWPAMLRGYKPIGQIALRQAATAMKREIENSPAKQTNRRITEVQRSLIGKTPFVAPLGGSGGFIPENPQERLAAFAQHETGLRGAARRAQAGLTEPVNTALMGTGSALPAIAGPLLTLGFGYQAAPGIAERWKRGDKLGAIADTAVVASPVLAHGAVRAVRGAGRQVAGERPVVAQTPSTSNMEYLASRTAKGASPSGVKTPPPQTVESGGKTWVLAGTGANGKPIYRVQKPEEVQNATVQARGQQEAVPQVVRPGAGGQVSARRGRGQNAGGRLEQAAPAGQAPTQAAADQVAASQGTPQVVEETTLVKRAQAIADRLDTLPAGKEHDAALAEQRVILSNLAQVRERRWIGELQGGNLRLYRSAGLTGIGSDYAGGVHYTPSPERAQWYATKANSETQQVIAPAGRYWNERTQGPAPKDLASDQSYAGILRPDMDEVVLFPRVAAAGQVAAPQGPTQVEQPVPTSVPPSGTAPTVGAAATPSTTVSPLPNDVTGVAKAVTQRPPQTGISIPEEYARGKELVDSGALDPHLIAQKTLESGTPMSDEHLSAVGYKVRILRNTIDTTLQQAEQARKSGDLVTAKQAADDLAAHDAQMETLLSAADLTLNKGFHRLGMAAQIALDRGFQLQDLPRRAKAALMGTPEPADMAAKLDEFRAKNAGLEKQLAEAQAELAKKLAAPQQAEASTVTRTGQVRTRAQQKRYQRDIDTIQKFFGAKAGAPEPTVPGGSKMGREQGAANLNYTIPTDERLAMQAVRRLAKEIAPTTKDLKGVLDGIRKETGLTIPDEQLYRMLSDKYRNHLLEADVNAIQARRYLSQIQRAANYQLKSNAGKAWVTVKDFFNTTQRSFRAGMDISAPFIQGRRAPFVIGPKGARLAGAQAWLRAWAPMWESVRYGEDAATRQYAAIAGGSGKAPHPMWPRAKAAGLELTEAGGPFTSQEEVFAGSFVQMAENYLSKPGARQYIGAAGRLYLKGLRHSEAAYTAFLNAVRWDTFVKLAQAAPDDPAYLRDIASTINTIYGRGGSPTAKAIGRSALAGNLLFAPRYTIAQLEYAAGRPIYASKTAAGKMAAFRIYAAEAAAYASLIAMARMAGWNVDTDPRSTDFGKMEAVMPGTGGKTFKFDVFAKPAQAYRLVAQLLYGKIGETGNYTPPSWYEGTRIGGQYLVGKAAPLPKGIGEIPLGKLTKQGNKYITRPKTWVDFFPLDYTPLWILQSMDDGTFRELPVLTPLKIAGQDIEPGRLVREKVPMDRLRPGIFQRKRQTGGRAVRIR